MNQKTEASQAVNNLQLNLNAFQSYEAFEIYANEVRSLRAALKAQPAPAEAANFCARCGKRLHAGSIHTCTPPAPTEAAHGALSTNHNLTTSGVTCQPVAAQGDAIKARVQELQNQGLPLHDDVVLQQLSGNSGELQPSGNTGELAQGEDSARLDAVVEANRALLHQRSQLGIKKYGDTLEAKRYPHKELLMHALLEALDLSNYLQAAIMGIDRASAETGGVSRADLAKLLSDANPGDAT